MPTKMTPKQERFCVEYLVDLNATQAAIRAGYSEKTARSVGCENLTKPDISDRIAALQEERQARTLVTADDVVRGLDREARREGEGASHSARVSAWGHLAKITGASGPKGSEDDPHYHELQPIQVEIINKPQKE